MIPNPSNFYMIREIKQWLSFISFSIFHILHEGNVVVDYLALICSNLLGITKYVGTSLPNKLKGLVRMDHSEMPYVQLTIYFCL